MKSKMMKLFVVMIPQICFLFYFLPFVHIVKISKCNDEISCISYYYHFYDLFGSNDISTLGKIGFAAAFLISILIIVSTLTVFFHNKLYYQFTYGLSLLQIATILIAYYPFTSGPYGIWLVIVLLMDILILGEFVYQKRSIAIKSNG